MATKYVSLPQFASTTGMYAFLYLYDGTLINPGGDALSLVTGSGGTFIFDVSQDLSAAEYVEVRVHGSSTPSDANFKFQGSLARGTSHVRDTYPPAATPAEAGSGFPAGLLVQTGVIVGFPDQLVVGDNYSESTGNSFTIYVRTVTGTPITGYGDVTFEDDDFEPVLTIVQGQTSIVRGVCEWVPAVGETEGYLKVELPSSRTRKASPGSARLQLVFRWSNGVEVTPVNQEVYWVAKNVRQ